MHVLSRALTLRLVQEWGLLDRPGRRYRKRILQTNRINHSYADLTMNLCVIRMVRDHTYAYPERPEENFRLSD